MDFPAVNARHRARSLRSTLPLDKNSTQNIQCKSICFTCPLRNHFFVGNHKLQVLSTPQRLVCFGLLWGSGENSGLNRAKRLFDVLNKGRRKENTSVQLDIPFLNCTAVSTEENTHESSRDSTNSIRENAVPPTLTVTVVSSIASVNAEDWNACALDATGLGSMNPFLLHAFFLSLEESGSTCTNKGWLPQHLVAKDGEGVVLGVVPLYLKSHSYGEYVFDHSWASAYQRYGRSYYPKLQSCVPFTPATGPRILLKNGPMKEAVFEGLCEAMKQLTVQFNASSLHVTFPTKSQWEGMAGKGFLQRMGMQYHWRNRNYKKFDDFLMDLKMGKRKNIRQERKKVAAQGLVLKRLRGDDIKPHHWDSFYNFYLNTTDNKWGRAYLTRDFFHLLGERMGDNVLLVVAEKDEKCVAGALNLIGGDTLFGRNWGCQPGTHFPFLHFEACYYQAIDAAIEWGLQTVEAGAQGEHKIQRGYLPTPTYSAHYFAEEGFSSAVSAFLSQETFQMAMALEYLDKDANPFKDGVFDDNSKAL